MATTHVGHKLLLFFFLFLSIPVLAASAQLPCNCMQYTDVPGHKYSSRLDVESKLYQYGTVNGVKLAIPDNFIFHQIVYEGDSRDGSGPASMAATVNSIIDNFGILLKLSTLQPITTDQDLRDWHEALAHPLFSKSWMMVSFDNHYPVIKNPNSDFPKMVPNWGPYTRDKKMPYGLLHYESVQSIDDGDHGAYGHVEYFYRRSTLTTIMCQTRRKKIYPFDTFDICEHHFLIADLNLMAEAFYTKRDLYRWHDIELRVNDIARSFIQK